jgi:Subtilase family
MFMKNAWFAGLFSCLIAGSSALAQERVNNVHAEVAAPGVLLWFQGDLTGNNVSSVLTKLYGNQTSFSYLAKEPYIVGDRDTLCGILEKSGYPPPCEGYLPLLDLLNKDQSSQPISKRPLQAGMTISLPALKLTEQSSYRVFSKTDKVQSKQGAQLVQNLRDLKAERVDPDRPNDSFAVKFTSYKMLVPAASDDAAQSLYMDLLPMSTKNVFITPLINAKPSAAKFNTYPKVRPSSQIRADCLAGKLNDKVEQYAGLLDGDLNALDAMNAELKDKTPVTVPLIIIDTILQRAPNIVQRFGDQVASVPTQSWTCQWGDFVDVQNHATHMAGLIAGSGKPFGFQGVTDNVRFFSYELWKPDSSAPNVAVQSRTDREFDLSDFLMSNYQDAKVLPVYLAALQFEDYPVSSFETADKRFDNRPLELTIKSMRPLLIAAAGQRTKPSEQIVSITNLVPFSPQNLGDLENVVVVTACVVCSGNDPAIEPKLMADAYYSGAGQRMVHVAAPGAEPIAGWIDNAHIGEAMGTSQAAAYVAGLAASMIGYYSDVYREAKIVKIRLQVTSRPIPPRYDNTENSDAKKIAAGIVDPVLARLDPSKHWLKDAGSWKAVKIAKWPVTTVSLTNMLGRKVDVKRGAILRISKTKVAKGASPNLWSYYVNAVIANNGQPADVDRYDFLKTITPSTITFCDGNSTSIDKIDDLIISAQGISANECAL